MFKTVVQIGIAKWINWFLNKSAISKSVVISLFCDTLKQIDHITRLLMPRQSLPLLDPQELLKAALCMDSLSQKGPTRSTCLLHSVSFGL